MKDTLERIRRIRDHGKRMARLELVRAENERSDHRRRQALLDQRIETARSSADASSVADMASYHSFRMRMEVASRRTEHAIQQAELRVEDKREKVSTAARESEVIKLMLENRIEEERVDQARSERGERDEAAVHAWMKKAS